MSTRHLVYGALTRGPLTVAQLEGLLGIGRSTVRTALDRGVEAGYFCKLPGHDAGYGITDKVMPSNAISASKLKRLSLDEIIVMNQLAHGPQTIAELAKHIEKTPAQAQKAVYAKLVRNRRWVVYDAPHYKLTDLGREALPTIDDDLPTALDEESEREAAE